VYGQRVRLILDDDTRVLRELLGQLVNPFPDL